ncbi:hypothetical protein F1737_03915 [Methanoplanus sp. FWC-SCC4]|uniref:Zinc ribbon domain-containing protein n=1 Tax=Methanochimaera problematica TaxID=2609417 RepID=A0AA97I432_9EURY|nr:hypothetical protein [Methanoplanus sp. FWC-SCC4]WOF15901.1 hypothetical protein F1737_03915 [Methanoplanus sp. FWC-SCC4]
MSERIVFGMNCPSCGGRVEVEEGEQLVLCPFCHSAHSLESKDGISKFMYKIVIDKDEALKTVKYWFTNNFKARDLPEKGEITEVYSVYLPFWRLFGRGKAIVCGYSEDKDDEGHKSKTNYNNIWDSDYVYTQIACDAGDIGVSYLRNLKGEIIPYEEEEIPTFEATESKTDAEEAGKIKIQDLTYQNGKGNIEKVTFSKVFVDTKAFELIFYPLWVVRYDYFEKDYFAVIDGVTGDVLSGRAPGDPYYQSLSIGAGGSIGGLITGIGLGYSLLEGSGLFVATSIVGLSVLYLCYNQFRYKSEIISGDLQQPSFNLFKKAANASPYGQQNNVEIVLRK